MTPKKYYSLRTGKNPNLEGFGLADFCELFLRLYNQLYESGYFQEALGYNCIDAGFVRGKVVDVEYEILIKIRKKRIWPIHDCLNRYEEDDLFDVIEFLYEHVSKPIESISHGWNGECVHWETFNKAEGQKEFREKVNELLDLYKNPFIISQKGEILQKPEKGFEKIFAADIPSKDKNVNSRVEVAVLNFRRHGASLDDRRQAVRDLTDVLEYLRPQLKSLFSKQDEADLFNIANNFGIRHHNDRQKTDYDTAIWLSWMFYFFLATIHVVLRKIEQEKLQERQH